MSDTELISFVYRQLQQSYRKDSSEFALLAINYLSEHYPGFSLDHTTTQADLLRIIDKCANFNLQALFTQCVINGSLEQKKTIIRIVANGLYKDLVRILVKLDTDLTQLLPSDTIQYDIPYDDNRMREYLGEIIEHGLVINCSRSANIDGQIIVYECFSWLKRDPKKISRSHEKIYFDRKIFCHLVKSGCIKNSKEMIKFIVGE